MQKYESISIINTFCAVFYNILSKNVRICNFAHRKGTLVLPQIMGHLQKILKKITRRHSHPRRHTKYQPVGISRIRYREYRKHLSRQFGAVKDSLRIQAAFHQLSACENHYDHVQRQLLDRRMGVVTIAHEPSHM